MGRYYFLIEGLFMAIKFSNNARTNIASSVESTDTQINVLDASVFPTLEAGDVLYLTIANITNTENEIVKCTAITGNVLTVSRGEEGTTPVNWGTTDNVSSRLTAELLETITSRTYTQIDVDDDVRFNSVEVGDFANEAGGIFSWNPDEGTVDLAYDGVTLQLGQEQHVYGKATEAIPNGAPVMFAGAQGEHILIARADQNALGFEPKWLIGVATDNIEANAFGYVTSFGYVRDLDTSAFAEGAILYLDTSSPGQLTDTAPVAPNHVITVAAVTRSHANVGTIFSRPSFALDLHELCDVNFADGDPSDGNLLEYDATNSYWNHTSTPTLDALSLRPDEDIAHAEGKMYYNDEYKTLTVFTDVVGSSLQVGLEEWVRVYNGTGSTIPNGTPLYAVGSQGESISVAPADATTEAKARVIAIATNDIANLDHGWGTTRGLISGIDTSGLTEGSGVHLGPTGGLQSAAPTYPYFPTDIGTCVISDATNGYVYVEIEHHTYESFRVTGNQHVDGNLTVEGNLTIQGTQTITNEANLSISDSFIYLNSGDTIGPANTTFSGTGLNDHYFSNHYEGTTTTTYYVRIDGVGTGTGGVDTFEWSTDNFATTEATGVDLDFEVLLSNNICAHFEALTGHTSGDTWSGTAAPVNVDTGWFTNYNTGTTGIGYTHAGVYLDATDQKFKFIEAYSPEPSGNIDTEDASFTLGTIVATSFEGTATDADKLNSELPSYYLNYNNFTNTPTIGNATVTLNAGDGLSVSIDNDFALNDTTATTIEFVNDDKGSSQNIFKTITVDTVGQDDITADSNSHTVNLATTGNLTLSTDSNTGTITFAATETSHDDVLVDADFTANGFMKRTAEGVYAVDTNTYSLSSHVHNYLPLTGGTLTGDLLVEDDIMATGQIRATGWWNTNTGTGSDLGTEIGVSGGSSYLTSYNRTGSTYGDLVISAANINIAPDGAGTVTISGNTVWHAGNHGAGSGLDADTLDGYEATDFILTDNAYGGWTLKTDGVSKGNIASSEAVNFEGGTNVSLSYSATDNTITINSTDTNTDTDNYVDSLSFSTTTGILTAGRTGELPDLTVNLDNRYLRNESDTLGTVVARGAIASSDITVNGVLIGRGSGNDFTNTAVGSNTFFSNTFGSGNTTVGANSLASNITGGLNTAIGVSTLNKNEVGTQNTAVGSSSLFNSTSSSNTGVGTSALYNNTTGTNNLAIGKSAGYSLTTGSNNTIIGSLDGTAGMADTMLFGAGSTERFRVDDSGNMAIGKTTAATKLDVNGVITAEFGTSSEWNSAYDWGNHALAGYLTSIPSNSVGADELKVSGNGAVGQVLSSDGDGTMTWADAASPSYIKKTAAYTASAGENIIADTSGSAWTLTLPATPSAGDVVTVAEGTGWDTNVLTVGRNGETIEGDAEDLIMDVIGVRVDFVYDGATWQIYSSAGDGTAVSDSGSMTASEILTAVKTVDGTGSGLDADLLDGQEGSYYYPASNPAGYTNNTGRVIEGGGAFNGTFPIAVRTSENVIRYHPTILINGSASAITISGFGVWHGGNHGAGSGLDADLLHGIQGNQFLTKSTYFDGGVQGYSDSLFIASNSVVADCFFGVGGFGTSGQLLSSLGNGQMAWVNPPTSSGGALGFPQPTELTYWMNAYVNTPSIIAMQFSSDVDAQNFRNYWINNPDQLQGFIQWETSYEGQNIILQIGLLFGNPNNWMIFPDTGELYTNTESVEIYYELGGSNSNEITILG